MSRGVWLLFFKIFTIEPPQQRRNFYQKMRLESSSSEIAYFGGSLDLTSAWHHSKSEDMTVCDQISKKFFAKLRGRSNIVLECSFHGPNHQKSILDFSQKVHCLHPSSLIHIGLKRQPYLELPQQKWSLQLRKFSFRLNASCQERAESNRKIISNFHGGYEYLFSRYFRI